jgi:hypothetical protein
VTRLRVPLQFCASCLAVAAVAPAASVSPFAGSSPPVSGGPARSGGAGKGGADSVKGKHGKVKNFLLGWLPQRTPPRDLVERGILPDEPLRTRGSPTTGAQGNAPNAIFGNDLAAILRRADTVDGVPRAVEILMSRLRADGCAGLRNEGIFRVPGDATEMRELRDAMNQGRDPLVVLSQCQNVHSVAGMLKMFYRELSPPLLSFALYDDLISASSRIGAPDEDADLSELMGLLRRLPQGNQDSLCHLFGFLVEVTQNASESKMTVGNTAAVFAPNLLRPERETLQHLADTGHVVNLIATMIAKYEQIFLCRSPTTTTPDDSMASLRLSRDSSSSLALSRSPQHSFVSMNSTSHGSLQHASSTLFPGAGEVEPVEESAGGDSDEDEDETNALKWYWLTPDSQQQGPVRRRASNSDACAVNDLLLPPPPPPLHTQHSQVSWADLHAMSQAMEIDGSTYLFCDGLGDWKTAADLGLC